MMENVRSPAFTVSTQSCSPSLTTDGSGGALAEFRATSTAGCGVPEAFAHLDQFLEGRLGRRIGIDRDRRQQGEVALRSHSGMGAIHREIAVAQGIDARRNHLAAAIGALAGKTEHANQGALRDAEAKWRRRPAWRPPEWSCASQISHQGPAGAGHPVSLRLDYRRVTRRADPGPPWLSALVCNLGRERYTNAGRKPTERRTRRLIMAIRWAELLERETGFEPATSTLARSHSTS